MERVRRVFFSSAAAGCARHWGPLHTAEAHTDGRESEGAKGRDPSTEQLLHRYKLPFKVHAVNPPPKKELFKWRKGREEALQLDGDRRPGAHRRRHHRAAAPALVDAPPLQSRREQARAIMWSRVAARGANLRRKESGAQTAGFECAVR